MSKSKPTLDDYLKAVSDGNANPQVRAIASEATKEQTQRLLNSTRIDKTKED